MSWKTWNAIACAVLVTGTASALGESVWVQNENTNILNGKSIVAQPVGTAKKGTELQVVSRDGRWIQVQLAGGQQGWVHDSNLSPKKVNADFFAGVRGDSAAGVNTAAAARGWDQATDQYAANKRMSKAGMDRLLAIKKSISPAEAEGFAKPVAQGASSAPMQVIQPALGMPMGPAGMQPPPGYVPPAPQPGYAPVPPQAGQPRPMAPQGGQPYAPQGAQPYAPQPAPPAASPPGRPSYTPGQPYTPAQPGR